MISGLKFVSQYSAAEALSNFFYDPKGAAPLWKISVPLIMIRQIKAIIH